MNDKMKKVVTLLTAAGFFFTVAYETLHLENPTKHDEIQIERPADLRKADTVTEVRSAIPSPSRTT